MKSLKRPFVEIYADGACSGNPGIGGYGAILKSGIRYSEISGCEKMTTNNRMELLGVISALGVLKRPCRVIITTDSTYIVKGMTEWIEGWQKKNWLNSRKKEVLNRDLWERLIEVSRSHEIEWVWVKGHNDHRENERCDKLAREEIKKCKKSISGERPGG